MATVPAMLAGTGCYEYRASPVASVKPGQSVHVVLNQDGAAALTSSIGPNAASLDGKILRVSADEVTIAVTQIVRIAGPEEFMKDEPLSFPLAGATSATVRSLDKPRTVLAIGAILTGVVLGNIIANQAGIFTTKSGPSSSTK